MSANAFFAFFVRPACISAYPFSNSSLNSASDNVLISPGLSDGIFTSREEIEHIAPRHLYPEFEYTTKNLAMSCQFCNSSSKKGKKNTIGSKNAYYNKCTFTIVHPYYDDVDHFFENRGAIINICSGLTSSEKKKAQNTMDMFDLYESHHVEARAMQLLWEVQMKGYTLDEANERLLECINTYI